MMKNDRIVSLPSSKEGITFVSCLIVWLGVTVAFIGFRFEHILLTVLLSVLFFLNAGTRKFIVALVPFAIFGISYDWMNLLPNYEVNSVDICGIYEAEKNLFGISEHGILLTANEFFRLHTSQFMDFMAGLFYLCWVPVPILFGIWLYFDRQRKVYLHFALVFLFVNLIGFVCYYIHPAAPPWYVMSHGFEMLPGTKGEVAGLGAFDEMTGWNVFHALYARNANVFAAVPSLHSAYMPVAFWYSLRSRCPIWVRVLLSVIMFGIWFTAVYTSHHYVIDVLLGICCSVSGIVLFECVLMRLGSVKRFVRRYVEYIS